MGRAEEGFDPRFNPDDWMMTGCPDDGPTMAVDRSGAVHIVWPTLVDGPEPAIHPFHASTIDGKTFTPRQMVQTLGSPQAAHPQMILDSCGDLAPVWDEAQDKTRRIALTKLVTSASSVPSQSMVVIGDPTGILGSPSKPPPSDATVFL